MSKGTTDDLLSIRRYLHGCWKKGATKSCLGVDYICFAHPDSRSELLVTASQVIVPLRPVVLSDRSAVQRAVVAYNLPSTTRADLVVAQPGNRPGRREREQYA